MKIKVCGMKSPENIKILEALKPDYMGFIFYEKSPRNFGNVLPEISSEIKKTGVFVNASVGFILERVKEFNFSAIQLHGEESVEFCRELRKALSNIEIEILKVFSVKEEFDFSVLAPYEEVVDFFLFDTKGKNRGGNGLPFNWDLLKDYPSNTPFFLSGGIGIEDVPKIEIFRRHLRNIQKDHLLYAVDVNSKFELEPGLKDVQQLKLFKGELMPLQENKTEE